MTRPSGVAMAGLILVLAVSAARCSRAEAPEIELQRVKSGALDVVLLSPRGALRHGKDTCVIEFRSAPDGKLVDVGNVRVTANMPMPGMPMFGNVDVQRTDVPGRYAATVQLEMAGTWRMTIQWEGPAGQGSVSFAGTVQ